MPSGIVLLSWCTVTTLLQSWKASNQLELIGHSCAVPELSLGPGKNESYGSLWRKPLAFLR